MKLNLSVEGRVLASVAVEETKAANDYYLKAFRRLLTIRHYQKLARLKKEPTFFLEQQVETKKRYGVLR